MGKNNEPSTDTDALRLLQESPDLQFDAQEQHERLLEIDTELTYNATSEHVGIEIVQDDQIAVNGMLIAVNTGAKRFFFNEVRKWQGYQLTAQEIREAGFRGGATAFEENAAELIEALFQAAGQHLIEVGWVVKPPRHRHKAYTLLPDVLITDCRADWRQLSAVEQLLRVAIHLDGEGAPLVQDECVMFKGFRQRVQVAARMVNDFKESAGAEEKFKVLDPSLRLFNMDTGRIRRYRPQETAEITPQEQHQLFKEIDKALCAYVTAGGEPGVTDSETIRQGVRACFDLFYANLNNLRVFAATQSTDQVPFAELYQAGAEDLMEQVLGRRLVELGGNFLGHMKYRFYTQIRPLAFRRELQAIDYYRSLGTEIRKVARLLTQRETNGEPPPSLDELCSEFSMDKPRMLGILALRKKPIELDDENVATMLDRSTAAMTLSGPDTFEAELASMEREDALNALFGAEASDLTDAEKIILSLHYQIFHPALRGAEVFGQGVEPFTYPYTAEAFQALAAGKWELNRISLEIFGKSDSFATARHRTALRKAKDLLASFDGLDSYGNHRSDNPIDVERRVLIEQAIEVSPKKALNTNSITRLYKQKKFAASRHRIVELFGSVPDFAIACGFKPEQKAASRMLSDQDIISMALTKNPRRPLTLTEIKDLSAKGEFVGLWTIKTRWGSRKKFNIACGFEG